MSLIPRSTRRIAPFGWGIGSSSRFIPSRRGSMWFYCSAAPSVSSSALVDWANTHMDCDHRSRGILGPWDPVVGIASSRTLLRVRGCFSYYHRTHVVGSLAVQQLRCGGQPCLVWWATLPCGLVPSTCRISSSISAVSCVSSSALVDWVNSYMVRPDTRNSATGLTISIEEGGLRRPDKVDCIPRVYRRNPVAFFRLAVDF